METPERVKLAIEDAIKAAAAKRDAEARLAEKKSQEAALRARMAALEKALEPKITYAWCADATEDATGQVGTIELNGETDQDDPQIVIAPLEVLPTLQPGEVAAREVQSGAQAYFNAAILPGWQKYRPTYRSGRIYNIDMRANTCSVDLDAARSSAENLDINQTSSLHGVPVRYMSCDATAFADDDRVIVEFPSQNWSQPVVIGFVERPRQCREIAIMMQYSKRLPSGYPEEEVEDWTLKPYKTEFFTFDPSTASVKNYGIREDSYSFTAWVEGGVGNVISWNNYASTMTISRGFAVAAYRRQTWLELTGTLHPYDVISNTGQQFDAPAMVSYLSPAANEFVALLADGPYGSATSVVVLDAQSMQEKRRWTYPGDSLSGLKAHAGMAAMFVHRDGLWETMVVIDHRTGEEILSVPFGSIVPAANRYIVDFAISAKYLAVLSWGAVHSDRAVWLYDLETGNVIDQVLAVGALALAMNDKYVVVVGATGEIAASLSSGQGEVDIYHIVEGYGLSYDRTVWPFAMLGDAGRPAAQ